jgi:hypothetical protein
MAEVAKVAKVLPFQPFLPRHFFTQKRRASTRSLVIP